MATNVNGNIPIPGNTQVYTGNEQETTVPGGSTTIQMGDASHVVAPDTQTPQPLGQGGQPFPNTVDPNVTANATTQLGVPNTPAQPQPIENRTVADANQTGATNQTTAAGQAKAPPKSYKFTFKQLNDICNGEYNVGEVALDKNGKLTKINNHVNMGFLNKTVTSPADNARLRQQVYDCIVDRFDANLAQDVKDALTNNLKDILFGEGRSTQSLSRDELGYLLRAGIEHEFLLSNPDALKAKMSEIRNFKLGRWEESATWQSSKDELFLERNSDPSNDRIRSRYLLHMRRMIKGLDTVNGQEVRGPGDGMIASAISKKVNFDNVCAVSVNAKRDVVRNVLRPFADELKGQFADSPYGLKDVVSLRHHLRVRLVALDGMSLEAVEPTLNASRNFEFGKYGNASIYKDDFAALMSAAVEQVDAQDVSDADKLKKAFCNKLMELTENFCKSRLDRLNGPNTNPAKALQANANPKSKTKTYLRQCFYSFDHQGKKNTRGTNFCFMNSVINSVLASNNKKAQEKLAGMFTENGLKLYDNNGELQEHKYDNPALSKDGNVSFYEQSLNNHFKLLNGQQYDYSAGNSFDAAKALGMREVEQEHKFAFAIPMDDNGMITDPHVLKERQKAYVDELNGHIRSGKFAVQADGNHFVAVKGVELLKNGLVKVSIVDDRADFSGKFEYDRMYTFAQFQAFSAQIDVLSWPDTEGN